MDEEFRAKIEAGVAQLEKEREQFVVQANQQMAACNGGIEELKALLEPEPEEPPASPATGDDGEPEDVPVPDPAAVLPVDVEGDGDGALGE